MILSESIHQVINRADIVEVIGNFISVKKRGTNYLANCPFHNEKTPSFNINPAKGIYKCFGCGKGGDVVSFIEEYEKFTFVEAIRWLATFYQIELQETANDDNVKQIRQIEESLRILNDFATNYYQNILLEDQEGQNIGGSYFKQRGFTNHTIQLFKLGYGLESRDAFYQVAKSNGFSDEVLEKSGLVKYKENSIYDTYRGRVIFPIFSNTGKILGFGARILKKSEKAPKYINTPENELYIKNKVLYGLYQSRQAINKADECLLVEGYTDVISLFQAGIENVVSSSGTSLTTGQLKLIGNLTKNLTILYDGDGAGIKAAIRGTEMALSENMVVKIVLLPEGEDPDSFVQKVGYTAFNDYIQLHKKDVIEFMIDLGKKETQNDPIKKSALVNEIAEIISKIDKTTNFSLQQHYMREASNKLNIDEDGMVNLVNKFIREQVTRDKRQVERSNNFPPTNNNAPYDPFDDPDFDPSLIGYDINPDDILPKQPIFNKEEAKEEWQLLKVLLEYGDRDYEENETVAEAVFTSVDIEIIESKMVKELMMEYYQLWSQTGTIPKLSVFTNHLDKEIRTKMADLLQEKDELSHNWLEKYKIEIPHGDEIYLNEIKSTFSYFKLKLIKKYIDDNLKLLQHEKNESEIIKLMTTHQLLKLEEKKLMSIVIMK